MQRIYEGTRQDTRAGLAKVFAADELWSKLTNLDPELRNSLAAHLGEENYGLFIHLVQRRLLLIRRVALSGTGVARYSPGRRTAGCHHD